MLRTNKQASFVKHYIRTHNATESAKLAGYSQRTAYSSGQRLTKDVEVMSEIKRLEEAKCAELELTEANIIDRLWQEATTAQRSADRTNALTQLARIKGLMKEQSTVSVVNINDTIARLRDREAIQSLQPIDKQVDTEAIKLT